jgi:hypothetical protein
MRAVPAAALALTLLSAVPAYAIFAMVPADRVDEVPVERLLKNLQANAQKLDEPQRFRAIGRVHLLAYLRRAATLPVYRDSANGNVAEGTIDDCEKLDAQTMGKGNRDNFPPAKPGERCEARSYSLGPKREIPANAFAGPRGLDPHLAAAMQAYERARTLERDNLRTRVALAFVYDRAGRWKSARNELRYVMYQGLKQIPVPQSAGDRSADWETHTVVTEAAEHFEAIAKLWTDKRLVARVKKRLADSPPAMYVTPIVVPLKHDVAFEDLTDLASPVAFDFTGQGHMMQAGWLTKDAAWLVWDPKAKGRVTSGFQLFGSVTWIASWDNGYNALGALDDNGDGFISGAELDGLALWHDKNENGVSDDGEVEPVADHKIVALKYGHTRVGDGLWAAGEGVLFEGQNWRPTYDWVLRESVIQAAH